MCPSSMPVQCHPTDPAQCHTHVPARCCTRVWWHPHAPLSVTAPHQLGATHVPQLGAIPGSLLGATHVPQLSATPVPQLGATRMPQPGVAPGADVATHRDGGLARELPVLEEQRLRHPLLRHDLQKPRGRGGDAAGRCPREGGGAGSPAPRCTPCPPGSHRRACPHRRARGCRTPRTAASAPPRSSSPP